MRRKRSQLEERLEEQLELDYSRLTPGGGGNVITWSVENVMTAVAMATIGMAIVATLTAKPQATPVRELERLKAPQRPRAQATRGEASSSRPGRFKSVSERERRENASMYAAWSEARRFDGRRGRGPSLGSWIPEPGGLILPAREALSVRDVCDAIREARETYE